MRPVLVTALIAVLVGSSAGAFWSRQRHRVRSMATDEKYFMVSRRWLCVHVAYGSRESLVRAARDWSSTRGARLDAFNRKGTRLAIDAAKSGRATGCKSPVPTSD